MKKFCLAFLALLIMIPTMCFACKHGKFADSIVWGEWKPLNTVYNYSNTQHERLYECKGVCTICQRSDPANAWQEPMKQFRKESHTIRTTTKSYPKCNVKATTRSCTTPGCGYSKTTYTPINPKKPYSTPN